MRSSRAEFYKREMTRRIKQCNHANLEKIEEDNDQGHSLFKCSDGGHHGTG